MIEDIIVYSGTLEDIKEYVQRNNVLKRHILSLYRRDSVIFELTHIKVSSRKRDKDDDL